MTEDRKQEIRESLKPIKDEIRKIIDSHATKASELAPNYPDPHTPIVAMVQMAIAQASVEYLLVCGCTVQEAVEKTTEATGQAMQRWLQTIYRMGQKDTPAS